MPARRWRFVFPTSTGKSSIKDMLRGLAPVMVAAGLVERASPNMPCTRSAISSQAGASTPGLWAAASFRQRRWQTFSGHASIVMTLDIYGHLFPRGDERVRFPPPPAPCSPECDTDRT